MLDRFLRDIPDFTNDEAWERWQTRVEKILNDIDEKHLESVRIWAIDTLESNLEIHLQNDPKIVPIGINPVFHLTDPEDLKEYKTVISEGYQLRITFFENFGIKGRQPLNKIQWLGSQQELAELFIELKKKGWIADFEKATISECFTKSKTISQYLKPGSPNKGLLGHFEQVYTNAYTPKFYGILENPKRE